MIPLNHQLGPAAGLRMQAEQNKQPNTHTSRGRNLQNANSEVIEMSGEFARSFYVLALRTVSRGVSRGVCGPVVTPGWLTARLETDGCAPRLLPVAGRSARGSWR